MLQLHNLLGHAKCWVSVQRSLQDHDNSKSQCAEPFSCTRGLRMMNLLCTSCDASRIAG